MYVYLNDVQLLLGTDYTFSTTDDSISISKTLAEGDKIVIKDYADTTGSYMPPSPTKLGMYPKFTPEAFTDTTYLTDTAVIRKHDGSIIKAYGDERDALILVLSHQLITLLQKLTVSWDQTSICGRVVTTFSTSTTQCFQRARLSLTTTLGLKVD
jgi:hypothetical protein